MHFKLLALDLDGTLLDPRGQLRPRVVRAVAAARAHGVAVVVCTGRRLGTSQPVLDALGLTGPAVVQNGVVLKDARDGTTLRSAYLEPDAYRAALEVSGAHGTPLVYIDDASSHDIVTLRDGDFHDCQREYLDDNREATRFVPSLSEPPARELVMMSLMAPEEALVHLHRRVERELSAQLRTHFIANKVYRGHILEMLSPNAGKWPALASVAKAQGIDADAILAIGDDQNDAEMLARAGLGLAMGNATRAAQQAADEILPSNEEDGVAVAIERHILS